MKAKYRIVFEPRHVFNDGSTYYLEELKDEKWSNISGHHSIEMARFALQNLINPAPTKEEYDSAGTLIGVAHDL